MPSEKHPKAKSVESLRHAEYYDMQRTFDELYTRSQAREVFDNLMELILSKDNIMLAYRNIKSNSGSANPGTDRLRITDIGRLPADEVVARVRKIVRGGTNGYTPRSVRRKEIPKPNGKTRPLGIPCIWDRLIQQCIKQVMEPICEAKFSSNSYGFRPNRSVENAIAAIYRLMQRSGLYYVVEFDVKGFFDNVDHSKLIRQLWSMNIRDKELLYVIRRILKAPIQMPDGHLENPKKGTPQGGIISPLLANVVLNELLNVTLTNKTLPAVILPRLNEQQREIYTVMQQLKGNKPYLWEGIYNGGEDTGPSYEIPGEALDDPAFAALMEEATKYIGWPYVWGGSSPSTSFDCSGFVCWVYTASGVHNLPRTTAQGIYNQCAIISPSEAKPGDIIFFTGTYDSPGPVSHVGIYVGDGMMLHCGSPIQYANINSSYWQTHFYAFGRL